MRSREQTPCKYLVLTISPALFPRALPAMEQLMREKTDAGCSDYLLLEKSKSRSILSFYPQILKEIQAGNPDVLLTLSYVMALCSAVMPMIQKDAYGSSHDAQWLCLNEMTDYIRCNYQENVTLAKIAAAGKVCRSKCGQIFTKYMGQTPIEYLLYYRLKKSRELLEHTTCSIGEVAAKCGFSGQSYYTQTFRRAFGVTPGAYRKSKACEK